MDVLGFVEKLQKKPEPFRKKIVIMAVFVIMAVIIGFWFVTFNFSSGKGNSAKIKGPFESLKEDISNFYGVIKETFKRSE